MGGVWAPDGGPHGCFLGGLTPDPPSTGSENGRGRRSHCRHAGRGWGAGQITGGRGVTRCGPSPAAPAARLEQIFRGHQPVHRLRARPAPKSARFSRETGSSWLLPLSTAGWGLTSHTDSHRPGGWTSGIRAPVRSACGRSPRVPLWAFPLCPHRGQARLTLGPLFGGLHPRTSPPGDAASRCRLPGARLQRVGSGDTGSGT